MNTPDKFKLAQVEHEALLMQLGELTLAWSDVETVLFKLLGSRWRQLASTLGTPPNPSLHPTCYDWLRQPPPEGELPR